jgi:hypothetical protein
VEHQALRHRKSLRVGTADSLVLQEGELAEYVANPQNPENDFLAGCGRPCDPNFAGGNDMQIVARITFAKDVGARREPPDPHFGKQRLEVAPAHAGKQLCATKQRERVLFSFHLALGSPRSVDHHTRSVPAGTGAADPYP